MDCERIASARLLCFITAFIGVVPTRISFRPGAGQHHIRPAQLSISGFSRRILPRIPRCDWFDALPELTEFRRPTTREIRTGKPCPPAEAEVYIDERIGDVCVRKTRFTANISAPSRAPGLFRSVFIRFIFGGAAAHAAFALRSRDRATALLDGHAQDEFAGRQLHGRLARSCPGGRTAARGKRLAPPYLYSAERTGIAPQRGGRSRQRHQAGLHRSRELSLPRDFLSLADESRRAGSYRDAAGSRSICSGRRRMGAGLSSFAPRLFPGNFEIEARNPKQ